MSYIGVTRGDRAANVGARNLVEFSKRQPRRSGVGAYMWRNCCNHCHQSLVESYDAVVELVQNGEAIRKASLSGLHQWCARAWARAEIEGLRKKGTVEESVSSALSRVEFEH